MPPKQQTPICPKCGYDQSGTIATWTAQCPTQGRCNECGIQFQWANIFDPSRTRIHWYTEHTRSPLGLILKTPGTLLRILLPHRFWRAVDITKVTHPWRLIIWVMLIMLLAHLLISIPNGFVVRNNQNWSNLTLSQYYQIYHNYGIAENICDAIAFPFFDAHPQAYSHQWTLFVTKGRPNVWYEEFFGVINFQLGFLSLWLLILYAIPTTKKLAKIRSAHVIRAAALSFLMIFLSFELSRFLKLLYPMTGSRFNLIWIGIRLVVPAAVIWQILFWSSAISIGWKVRRWKLLVILGTLAALLGGSAFSIYSFLINQNSIQ